MAIIYTYPTKAAAAADLVLISDSADENKTKNASIASIRDAINVVDVISAGPGISVSNPTGNVTIGNTGVLSLIAGSNISLSGSTGNITISTSASNVDGSGTTNRIPRWTDSNTLGDSQISQNGSSIGVGTALGTASGSLEVYSGTLNNQLYITCPNTSQAGINFGGASSKDKGRISYSDNSDVMYFQTNSSEKMRILANGNLGIGTTAPNAKLHVQDTSGSTSFIKMSAASANSNFAFLKMLDNTVNTARLQLGTTFGYNVEKPALELYNGYSSLLGNGTNNGRLRFNCSANSHYVEVEGPDHSGASSYSLKLPNSLPSVSNQILESDGSGSLSWIPTPSVSGNNFDHWFAGCASVGSSSNTATNPRQASFTFPNEVGSSNFGPCIPIMADIEVMKVAIKWNGSNTPTIGASGTVDFKLGRLTNGTLNPDTQEGTVNYTNVADLTQLQITSADSGTWIYKFHNTAGTGVSATFNAGQIMVVVFPRPTVGWTGTGATNGDLQLTMQVKYI